MTAPIFVRYAIAEPGDGPLGDIVDLLAEGTLTRAAFDQIAQSVEPAEQRAFHDGLLDLLLVAAREFLRDHCLTGDEAAALRELTILFRIPEGEVVARRHKELGALLQAEMRRIAANGVMDWTEEDYLGALQAAFRMGYDEFLELACGGLTYEERRALRLPQAMIPTPSSFGTIESST